MLKHWDLFLAPYKQAVEELKVKLKGMRSQYELKSTHSPIEFVTGRVKPIPSVLDKAARKGIPLDRLEEEMQDIAGLRMMCQFVDDIPSVVEILKERNDFEVVEERNYITEKKESGYRSYHVVLRYPVQTIEGEKKILVEIQIRTLAMNFWATIEHSLNYKYSGNFPKEIKERLQRASEAAFQLDEEMSKIREEIQEAQVMFSRKKEK
ncbi:GTP pyrophosphokinase family protein [Priestia filamentosa]|jgi:putative GTP pyrophosphokinase|uniref:GTP pyrophosphokinase n=1 Tax=Priestia endophytica DSM 13796 TaxID=1121089 RepID=A0A1I6AV89_9BACI|nr:MULTISPECIES: GTP pyrophosphokinase family protein [Priestia]KAB2496448.1 GTP pyrophosphokinase family protein [Priestia endophytica]KYG31181.1 GTP pyrophosphokinase [Priestia endophytica]MBG9810902.1 GTP pyrophosphokinase [Priestia endophytica]MBG9813418.1 GTP pyrophosphokinase [Priestia endophytica]MCM3536540.1 GTP pyrophosphokinase family protein [Priestia endophytica]